VGKPRILVITTAFHHKHRYRLHSFLPYLMNYFDVDVVDVPLLSYDKAEGEPFSKLIARVARELSEGGVKEEPLGGGRIYTLRSLFPGDFGALATLPELEVLMSRLGRRSYATVLATPFLAGFLALRLKHYLKEVPIIYEDVDRFYDFFRNPLYKLVAKAIELWAIRNSDAVISASPHLYIEDVHVRRGKPTYFVPNGIEYARFRESALRAKGRNRYALVYVGAIEWWSGLDVAVNAVSLVAKEIPDVRLYIVGEYGTPFGIHLASLIKRLGLKDKVVFLGRRPYNFVEHFLPRCRIGLLTFPRSTVTERAFPYKVLEYCAAGTPVVLTRVGVLATLIEKYGAGIVHDVEDIEGLASGIAELITDDLVWREVSENAVRLASLFDVERLARLEADIIRSTYDIRHVLR